MLKWSEAKENYGTVEVQYAEDKKEEIWLIFQKPLRRKRTPRKQSDSTKKNATKNFD